MCGVCQIILKFFHIKFVQLSKNDLRSDETFKNHL